MRRRFGDAGDLSDAVQQGAAVLLRKVFDFQSLFSDTLLEQAILLANPAEPIISSTIGDDGKQSLAGVGFALHPMSQTPVAVQPKLGRAGSSSVAVTLKPGQVFYPGTAFEGFTWGLPNGWLGGGTALLYVLREKIADAFWTGSPEVIFHRARFITYVGADNPLAGAPGTLPNWPTRFPWPNAVAGLVTPSVPQALGAQIGIVPTKFSLRVRNPVIAGAAVLRLVWSLTDDLDLGQLTYDAAIVSGSFVDVTIPLTAGSAFKIGGVVQKEFPLVTLDNVQGNIGRIGGDSARLMLIAMDANIATGSFVDIVRYGTLGG